MRLMLMTSGLPDADGCPCRPVQHAREGSRGIWLTANAGPALEFREAGVAAGQGLAPDGIWVIYHTPLREGAISGPKTMITQRQIDFRQEYRSRIVGWYDGYFHIVIIYAMGAAAFYVYVQHIQNVTLLEWLTVPLTFL